MTATSGARARVGDPGGNPWSLYAQMVATPLCPALPELVIATRQMVATRFAPALPELAIATRQMVATRFAPALPELAIATSGNLDFSSCVYIGEGPGHEGR